VSRRPTILFSRGELTDWLLATLTTSLTGKLMLGDGEAPPGSGWPTGEPGKGVFIPYTVLRTNPANPDPGTPIGSSEADAWRANYALASFGSTRSQADWAADLARMAWDGLPKTAIELGSDRHWSLGSYQVSAMGAVTRNDQFKPALWETTDTAGMLVSRRHGP
jgi:hypothetical protein